jgi:hypothetical protein
LRPLDAGSAEIVLEASQVVLVQANRGRPQAPFRDQELEEPREGGGERHLATRPSAAFEARNDELQHLLYRAANLLGHPPGRLRVLTCSSESAHALSRECLDVKPQLGEILHSPLMRELAEGDEEGDARVDAASGVPLIG